VRDDDEFIRVAHVREITEDEGTVKIINDEEIAIFRVKGKYYAVSNICPHQHSPLIAEGCVENMYVSCPLHGWQFHLETGAMPNGLPGLKTFDVRVIDDEIHVRVQERRDSIEW